MEIILNPMNVIVAVVSFFSALALAWITHVLSRRRMVDELLFTARREAYTEFMKNFGRGFGSEKINLKKMTPVSTVEAEYERRQKVGSIFAQCRLVASPILEDKLRHLYDLIIEDFENKNLEENGIRERDYIGHDVEALMRHDLSAIGAFDVVMWRLRSILRRYQLKSKKQNRTKVVS